MENSLQKDFGEDAQLYRKSLLAALVEDEWGLAQALVYNANNFVDNQGYVTIDILQTALKEEQVDVVWRLTMMHLVTSKNLKDRLEAQSTSSVWDIVSYLLLSDIPTEVSDHLFRTWSRHKLISMFAMELSSCPERREELEIFFCKLVCEGKRCRKIAASIIPELDVKCTSEDSFFTVLPQMYKLFRQTKVALCKMSAKTLKKFTKCLTQSKSEECICFAVLLAAERQRWKSVKKICKRCTCHQEVNCFFHALSDEAWQCAAVILDGVIKYRPIPFNFIPDMDIDFIERVMKGSKTLYIGLPFRSVRESDYNFDSYHTNAVLSACWNLRLPVAGALMAMWVEKVRLAKRFMVQPMNRRSLNALLVMMMRDYSSSKPWLWKSALHILNTCPHIDLVSIVVTRAAELCFTVHCRRVVAQLLNTLSENATTDSAQATADNVLTHIIKNRHLELFQLCLAKNLHKLLKRSKTSCSILHEVVNNVADHPYFRDRSTLLARCLKAYEILMHSVEAGLTTQMTFYRPLSLSMLDSSPLWTLIQSNSFDAILLLHQTGAISNRELYFISINTSVEIFVEEKGLHAELNKLLHAASSVRSLKDLSALSVSCSIGCAADRKHRALGLPLPMALIRKVLFYDLLYDSELNASTPP